MLASGDYVLIMEPHPPYVIAGDLGRVIGVKKRLIVDTVDVEKTGGIFTIQLYKKKRQKDRRI